MAVHHSAENTLWRTGRDWGTIFLSAKGKRIYSTIVFPINTSYKMKGRACNPQRKKN